MKVLILALGIALVLMTSCGGGSGNNGGGGGVPGINVTVVSPTGAAALEATSPGNPTNQVLSITVEVTNDPAKAGVTWTVAAVQHGQPAGTFSDIQPKTVTYNPPANLTGPIQVTVTANSVTDPTRSASIPISLYLSPSITTKPSDLAVAFVDTNYTCIQTPITGAGVSQIPCQVVVKDGLGPFTWSLDGSLLPDGLLLAPGVSVGPVDGAHATQIVGAPTLTGPYPFSLKVTDNLGGTATTALNINVAPGQLKVATPTLMTMTQGKLYPPVQLQASGGVPPYTWILSPALNLGDPNQGLPTGITLSANGVLSGTPTNGNTRNFVIQVTDSQSPIPAQAIFPTPVSNPQKANFLSLSQSGLDPTCIAGGSTVRTDTPYAFLFTGFDADGPLTISGSFTANGQGNLTGEEDVIRKNGAQLAVPLTAGSAISFDQGGRGCMTLSTASSSNQFRLSPTTKVSEGGAGFFENGRIVEFDDSSGTGTRGTGFFRRQDPNAFSSDGITGPYAFRLAGWDATGGRFAMAGTAAADAGTFTSVFADTNDAGANSGSLAGGIGTYGSVDANGRTTATITVGSSTYDLIVYIVDAEHMLLNSAAPAMAGRPLVSGEATASVGPFTSATLSNSHIYRFGGALPGSPDVGVGVLHFDGASAVGGTAYERNGGDSTTTTVSGQYAVDPTTGRFTFSGTAIPVVGYAVAAANGVTGYLVGTGTSAVSGTMEFQTNDFPPGYKFSPISLTYGVAVEEPLDPQAINFAGLEQDDASGNMPTSSLDMSGPAAIGLVPVQSLLSFRYTWNPEGSGAYGSSTFMVTNGTKIFYIDASPLNGHPAVIVAQKLE